MKKLFIPTLCAGLLLFGATASKAQTAKALIVNTTSEAEVNKIVESLKGADPSTYRLTVNYGTAPLSSIGKVGGATVGAGGGFNASDVIVIQKIITNGKDLQNSIISKLNTNLSKQSFKSVKLSAVRGRGL
ncbi:hypothetical protein [Pedobacter frigoris]|uniref:DUF4252 domain-containing protein n=1 Tax=Pedobacter frigoris TaxID=2571272 RepID=A0A4U1CNN0_9SPHI|nr:hypothetical protein [Pedobacter frigoris]TKC08856.1 hypothetical protein FA047_01805 [Pedobacter frigoris]